MLKSVIYFSKSVQFTKERQKDKTIKQKSPFEELGDFRLIVLLRRLKRSASRRLAKSREVAPSAASRGSCSTISPYARARVKHARTRNKISDE